MAYDLALLHTASRFDLSSQEGRNVSARWLADLFRDFEFDGQYNLLFLSRPMLLNPYVRAALERAFSARP